MSQLLVKYIFTSEKLSVQVHPGDAQTLENGLGTQGKEECWLVLSAKPGAKLGIGFLENVDADRMRSAAIDGSIEDLMIWHDVAPGDFFYIPANTVHAIGAGLTVLEVQQNSDITYRLYDYGRPRELHLDEGIAISLGEPYDLSRWHGRINLKGGPTNMVDGPYFCMDQVSGKLNEDLIRRYSQRPVLVVVLSGEVSVGNSKLAPGNCAVLFDVGQLNPDGDATIIIVQQK